MFTAERFCSHCGRKMIVRPGTGHQRFDPQTGEPSPRMELVCPRFDRSWRNLWWGGVGHKAYAIDDEDKIGPEIVWMSF